MYFGAWNFIALSQNMKQDLILDRSWIINKKKHLNK